MIPNTDYGETITSGQMETGAASIELTPEMFTLLSSGMYTDKILAAIREPICNARDAQVDTGEDVALEMHLPTRLEPFFHIRDFGNGLSEQQVLGYKEMQQQFNPDSGLPEEVEVAIPGLYLRYGKSTKRDSNLQIGGFGIGCKAPLAYSDSFIVESYQQGIVKTYTVYKENGIPNVAKLSTKMTTEQDGLKVKIAVVNSDISTFVQKAAGFLKFFNYPVDITGQSIDTDVKYILNTKLYDTVECAYGDQGKIKASMGGVVYNVSDKYREELEQVTKNKMLIMKFNIGDLAVAGSREALSEDEDTLEKLDKAVATIKAEFYAVMKAEVEDPKHSVHEALQILKKFDLTSRTWQTGKTELRKAAKGFTIGGEDANDVLEKFSDIKVRVIDVGAGSPDANFTLDSFKEVPIVLESDRGSGYLKVARKLSKDNPTGRCRVVLVGGPTGIKELQDYFGSVKVEKVSVKYPEYFPKGAPSAKIKVAASGLFTTTRTDIRELEETQEGWYIPFVRHDCIMKGRPGTGGFEDFNEINKAIVALIEAGQLKQNEVFYSRKAGMRAIAKTQLKEMTWDKVIELAKKCYTKLDYTDFVYTSARKDGNPAQAMNRKLAPMWDRVKHNYPTWNNNGRKIAETTGRKFITSAGLTKYLEPKYSDDCAVMTKMYDAEEGQFKKDYPMIGAFNYWSLTDDMITDLLAFYEWKAATKNLNKAA